jgi:hypothetical protein
VGKDRGAAAHRVAGDGDVGVHDDVDSICRVAIAEAVTAGCRVTGLVTATPSRSRVVSRAARASST